MEPDARTDNANWRGRKTAGDCLKHLCLCDNLADVWFTFAQDASVRLPAHKFVLSMRSEAFEAMFYGQMVDGSTEIHIDDTSVETLTHVLRFVYTDHLILQKDSVFNFLHVGKKYVLDGLHEQCLQFLTKSIDATNVCSIYEQVQNYDINGMVSGICLEYIWHHAWKVFPTDDFLNISPETLTEIIKSDNLTGEEIMVFRAVIKWAEQQCRRNDDYTIPWNLRQHVGGVLYNIRFPLMSIEEFCEEVKPARILSIDEESNLHQYITELYSGVIKDGDKFDHKQRNGGIMTEPIANAYPIPDLVPGGCNKVYNFTFCTSDDIRLHSLKGPLIKEIQSVRIYAHAYDENGISIHESDISVWDSADVWQDIVYSITEDDEIIFTREPILLPVNRTHLRIELGTQPGQKQNVEEIMQPLKTKLRGGRQRRQKDVVVARMTNMTVIIKGTHVSMTYIPPGISQISVR